MNDWLKIVPIAISCISVCIAVAAFTVAYRNFRLSRFPHVRIVPSNSFQHSINHEPDYFLDVEVESWGLPIYDLKVVLEVDYREHQKEIGLVTFGLNPVGTKPNPVNAGQVVKFQLVAAKVRELDSASWKFKRQLGISDLPRGNLRLVVYGSGGREIACMGGKKFDLGWGEFDTKKPSKPQPKSKAVEVREVSQEIHLNRQR